jgi:hypothetical protein
MFHYELRAEASPTGDNGWRDGDAGLRQADSVAESRVVPRAARRAPGRTHALGAFAWRSPHQRRLVAAMAAARARR